MLYCGTVCCERLWILLCGGAMRNVVEVDVAFESLYHGNASAKDIHDWRQSRDKSQCQNKGKTRATTIRKGLCSLSPVFMTFTE